MANEDQWFMSIGGQQVGPVSKSDIEKNLHNGSANGDTLLWRPGMGAWKKLREIPDFSALTNGSAPVQRGKVERFGLEPYFEIEVLRSDAADFARTFRAWTLALRSAQAHAEELVGADTVRRFQRYLVASEAQFRTAVLTNYRLVLHRRHRVRR